MHRNKASRSPIPATQNGRPCKPPTLLLGTILLLSWADTRERGRAETCETIRVLVEGEDEACLCPENHVSILGKVGQPYLQNRWQMSYMEGLPCRADNQSYCNHGARKREIARFLIALISFTPLGLCIWNAPLDSPAGTGGSGVNLCMSEVQHEVIICEGNGHLAERPCICVPV